MKNNMKTKRSNSTKSKPAGNQQTQSVQERAYELYLQRGQESGHELEDWLQAEQENAGQIKKQE